MHFSHIFSDFDGTLTWKGSIGSELIKFFNFIEKTNTTLIVVTGRSTAWGLFFLTHFPQIHAVITEGGGVIVRRKKDHKEILLQENISGNDSQLKLKVIIQKLKEQYPSLEIALDNTGRLTDYALELRSFEKDQSLKSAVMASLTSWGAYFTESNVHLNITCHAINKWKSVQEWCRLEVKNWKDLDNSAIYFGDSLNDESMFKEFKHSVGVANIQSCLSKMKSRPKIVLQGEENSEIKGVLSYLNWN